MKRIAIIAALFALAACDCEARVEQHGSCSEACIARGFCRGTPSLFDSSTCVCDAREVCIAMPKGAR